MRFQKVGGLIVGASVVGTALAFTQNRAAMDPVQTIWTFDRLDSGPGSVIESSCQKVVCRS
jgi:hypothetical protein